MEMRRCGFVQTDGYGQRLVQHYCHIKTSICCANFDVNATINKPMRQPISIHFRLLNCLNQFGALRGVCVIEIEIPIEVKSHSSIIVRRVEVSSSFPVESKLEMPVNHKALLPLCRAGEPAFMQKANYRFDIPSEHLV